MKYRIKSPFPSFTFFVVLMSPSNFTDIELAGRNYSCILNMYCQNAFGVTPTFKASSSLSGIHDFEVACDISGTPYAIGEGRTKKIAKQKAGQLVYVHFRQCERDISINIQQ